MKPIRFEGCNVTYAKDQREYSPLPGMLDKLSFDGCLTTCWKLTMRERIKLLFTGKLFLQVLTFHQPLQPLKFSLSNPTEGKRS